MKSAREILSALTGLGAYSADVITDGDWVTVRRTRLLTLIEDTQVDALEPARETGRDYDEVCR